MNRQFRYIISSQTGLYYYGARYYDPKISLWLSVDPLAEKYPNMSPYVYTYANPLKFVDPTGMEGEDWDDWYEKLDENGNPTGEIVWFDGDDEIEGYKHLGYDVTIQKQDKDGWLEMYKYDGDRKGLYKYNFETGKYDILIRNYDNSSEVVDYLAENYMNPAIISGKAILGALISGLDYGIRAVYTSLKEGKDLDGLNLFKHGYEMPIDFTHVTIYNNGQWVDVNLIGKGEKEFARIFTANFLKLPLPFLSAQFVNNKYLNKFLS